MHHINTPARNRSNAISKQLSALHTSLPEGIFVKIDETRSDVMKILMVGVQGTPYEGGLFSFDLLMGENFPISPPRMSFVLENVDEDQTPINPNLHIGGTGQYSSHHSLLYNSGADSHSLSFFAQYLGWYPCGNVAT